MVGARHLRRCFATTPPLQACTLLCTEGGAEAPHDHTHNTIHIMSRSGEACFVRGGFGLSVAVRVALAQLPACRKLGKDVCLRLLSRDEP